MESPWDSELLHCRVNVSKYICTFSPFFVDTVLLIISNTKIDCLLKLAPHMLYASN